MYTATFCYSQATVNLLSYQLFSFDWFPWIWTFSNDGNDRISTE